MADTWDLREHSQIQKSDSDKPRHQHRRSIDGLSGRKSDVYQTSIRHLRLRLVEI